MELTVFTHNGEVGPSGGQINEGRKQSCLLGVYIDACLLMESTTADWF